MFLYYTNFDFCLRVYLPDEIEIPSPIPGSSNQETNAPVAVLRPKPVSKKRKRTVTSEELRKKYYLQKIKNEKLERIVLNLQIKKIRLEINKLKD
jgi:hypothetical protein